MEQVLAPQIDSPFEIQAKGMQLRQMVQAGQDAQYQQQIRAQAMADDTAARTALRANPEGGAVYLSDLARTASPKDYMAAVKMEQEKAANVADLAQKKATTQVSNMDLMNKAFTLHRDQVNLVNDPATAAQWVAAAYNDPVLGPLVSQSGPLEDAVKRIPTDPAGFADWKTKASLNAEDYVKRTTVSADTQATNDRIASEGKLDRANRIQTSQMVTDRQGAGGGMSLLHGIKGLSTEGNDALSKAVVEGRLDPNRINSRTASLYADMALKNPGLDFAKVSADIALGRNAGYQQKTMVAATLPEVMENMVAAGKKVNFSDVRSIGKMQAWAKGELNDPDFTEYMNKRNDALMSIAGVMRGNGMTDMAHKAETEAAAMTMSPKALEAWLKGQMDSLAPRLKNNARIMHTDLHGQPLPSGGTVAPVVTPAPATRTPGPAAAPGARPSIDSFFK